MFIHVYPAFSVTPWPLQLSQPLPDQNSNRKNDPKKTKRKREKKSFGQPGSPWFTAFCCLGVVDLPLTRTIHLRLSQGKSCHVNVSTRSDSSNTCCMMLFAALITCSLFSFVILVPSGSISFHLVPFFLVVSQYRIPTSFCQVVPALMRRPSFPNFTAQPSGSFQSAAIFLAWTTNPFDSSMRQHATACEQKKPSLVRLFRYLQIDKQNQTQRPPSSDCDTNSCNIPKACLLFTTSPVK